VKGPQELQPSKKAFSASSSGGLPGSLRSRCVATLLEACAAVNVLPITMETPLLIASARGDLPLCEQLLAAEADPSLADRSGRTPLKCAANDRVRQLLVTALPEDATAEDLDEADGSNHMAGLEAKSNSGMDRPPQLRVMQRPQLLPTQETAAAPDFQHFGYGWQRHAPQLPDPRAAPPWPYAANGPPHQVGHAGFYNPAGSLPAAGCWSGASPMWWTPPPAQAVGPPVLWSMPNMAPRWDMRHIDMAAAQGQPPFG